MNAKAELPDDVIEYLTKINGADPEAIALLAKYAPEPETLADHGTIEWTRRFAGSRGAGSEAAWPEGLAINSARVP